MFTLLRENNNNKKASKFCAPGLKKTFEHLLTQQLVILNLAVSECRAVMLNGDIMTDVSLESVLGLTHFCKHNAAY